MGVMNDSSFKRYWQNVQPSLVRSCTKEEYESFSDDQKIGAWVIDEDSLMYNGKSLSSSSTANVCDSNPIGTVIAYLGLTPPKDYLVCDGQELNISEYKDLSGFIESEFGTVDYFGGDGVSTFAVPDFRNLFLRGYHGESTEALSGDVGKKQSGTGFLLMWQNTSSSGDYLRVAANGKATQNGSNYDTTAETYVNVNNYKRTNTEVLPDTSARSASFTARPVNAAVLYCIKAFSTSLTNGSTSENYSEEEIRIGMWIDGKPLYQKVVFATLPPTSSTSASISLSDLDIEEVVSVSAMALRSTNSNKGVLPIQTMSGDAYIRYGVFASPTALQFQRTKAGSMTTDSWAEASVTAIIKYTKTTD